MDGRVSDKAFCHQPENAYFRAEFTNLKRLRLESHLCRPSCWVTRGKTLLPEPQFPHLDNEAGNTFVENGEASLRGWGNDAEMLSTQLIVTAQ